MGKVETAWEMVRHWEKVSKVLPNTALPLPVSNTNKTPKSYSRSILPSMSYGAIHANIVSETFNISKHK